MATAANPILEPQSPPNPEITVGDDAPFSVGGVGGRFISAINTGQGDMTAGWDVSPGSPVIIIGKNLSRFYTSIKLAVGNTYVEIPSVQVTPAIDGSSLSFRVPQDAADKFQEQSDLEIQFINKNFSANNRHIKQKLRFLSTAETEQKDAAKLEEQPASDKRAARQADGQNQEPKAEAISAVRRPQPTTAAKKPSSGPENNDADESTLDNDDVSEGAAEAAAPLVSGATIQTTVQPGTVGIETAVNNTVAANSDFNLGASGTVTGREQVVSEGNTQAAGGGTISESGTAEINQQISAGSTGPGSGVISGTATAVPQQTSADAGFSGTAVGAMPGGLSGTVGQNDTAAFGGGFASGGATALGSMPQQSSGTSAAGFELRGGEMGSENSTGSAEQGTVAQASQDSQTVNGPAISPEIIVEPTRTESDLQPPSELPASGLRQTSAVAEAPTLIIPTSGSLSESQNRNGGPGRPLDAAGLKNDSQGAPPVGATDILGRIRPDNFLNPKQIQLANKGMQMADQLLKIGGQSGMAGSLRNFGDKAGLVDTDELDQNEEDIVAPEAKLEGSEGDILWVQNAKRTRTVLLLAKQVAELTGQEDIAEIMKDLQGAFNPEDLDKMAGDAGAIRQSASNFAGNYGAGKAADKLGLGGGQSAAIGGAIAGALDGGGATGIAKSALSWYILYIAFGALFTLAGTLPALIYLDTHYVLSKMGISWFATMGFKQKVTLLLANIVFVLALVAFASFAIFAGCNTPVPYNSVSGYRLSYVGAVYPSVCQAMGSATNTGVGAGGGTPTLNPTPSAPTPPAAPASASLPRGGP